MNREGCDRCDVTVGDTFYWKWMSEEGKREEGK